MRIGRNSLQLWHWSGCNEVQVVSRRNARATFISCAHILTPRQQTHTHIHKRTYNYTYTHTPAQLKRLPCYCCCFVAKGKYCLGQWCNNYFVGMWCELRLAAVGVRWSGITRVATTRLPLNFTVLFFFFLFDLLLPFRFENFHSIFHSCAAHRNSIRTQCFGHDVHGKPSWWLSLQLPHFVSGRLVVRAICSIV